MISAFQLIAPAGKAAEEKVNSAPSALSEHGFELKKDFFEYEPLSYLAADDDSRKKSLESAWLANEALLCLRGGYGCTRLLDKLDWEKMRTSQNVLIGHSDITALHLAFLKHGLKRTISGIMAAAEFTRSPDEALTMKSFRHCLKQEKFQHEWLPDYNSKTLIEAKGKLIPVTLSVLCSMLGSEHMPDFTGCILVLEDINEVPYKIDRMLTQLKLAGIAQVCNAIIMGDFNNCGDDHELHRVFADFAADLKAPVISGLPFGHCLPRLNLPVGALAELNFKSTATLKITRY